MGIMILTGILWRLITIFDHNVELRYLIQLLMYMYKDYFVINLAIYCT